LTLKINFHLSQFFQRGQNKLPVLVLRCDTFKKTSAFFNSSQTKILKILKETGGVEFPVLVEKLQMEPGEVEREFATLRHMEKVRGELREGKTVLCLW